MFATWLNFGAILSETVFNRFFRKISNAFWGMGLQGQIWNLLYLSQNWFNCHEAKCKHINWTLGNKWDHRVWPWPWPWLWIFKVKSGICYISAKNGSIATKQKANPEHIDWTGQLRGSGSSLKFLQLIATSVLQTESSLFSPFWGYIDQNMLDTKGCHHGVNGMGIR